MSKKVYLLLGLLMVGTGIVVVDEIEELQRERGSRRIRMLREAAGGEIKKDMPDLSSP